MMVADPFTYLQAVPEFSRLRLVESPPLPTAPNVTICLGSSTNLTAARNGTDPAGVLHWYNNSDLLPSHEVATGNSYNPGVPTPLGDGVYNYWVREIVTGGCEGPAKQVVLTIYPVITGNTISAAQTICSGQTPSALSGSGPSGGSSSYTYLWESSTTSSTGPWITATGTSNTQNYSPPALTTTTWYHRIVSSGPCSDISGAIQINVTPIPTATIWYAGSSILQISQYHDSISHIIRIWCLYRRNLYSFSCRLNY